MRRATITDVAKLAGVGKVTVSYVLNGRSRAARISEETEQRVLRAAQDLSYRPNVLARMLVTRRTQTMALVFQYADLFSSGSGFINEVMRGVCAATVEDGFDLMLHTKAVSNPDLEADVLCDGRVDGVLILRDQDDPTIRALAAQKFPTVLFFTRSEDPNAAWVDADNFAGARMAVKHLLELGHRRIGMLTGPAGSVPAKDRYQGYRAAMEAAGLDVREDSLRRCGNRTQALEAVPGLLGMANRPTALFCWSDEVAIAAMEIARDIGLRMPRELSIVGFDSLETCNRTLPPLTSVRQPIFEMAKDATHLLAAIINGEPVERRQMLFPLALDLRASTAPPLC